MIHSQLRIIGLVHGSLQTLQLSVIQRVVAVGFHQLSDLVTGSVGQGLPEEEVFGGGHSLERLLECGAGGSDIGGLIERITGGCCCGSASGGGAAGVSGQIALEGLQLIEPAVD